VWAVKGKSIYAQPLFHSSICKPVVAICACKMPYYFFNGSKHCKSIYKRQKRKCK